MLHAFDKRQSGGESAKKMAFAEKSEDTFRFMKAQGTGKICLKCHAVEVEPAQTSSLQIILINYTIPFRVILIYK